MGHDSPVQLADVLTGDAEKEAEAWGQFWNCRLADIKKDKLGCSVERQ